MNIYLILIVIVLIGTYLLDTIVEILNLHNISPVFPDEFKGIYSAKKYQKSQRYLRVTTQFGLIQSTLDLPITLAFILLGGFNSVDLFVRSFGLPEIGTGVLFTLAMIMLSSLYSLPFSLYSTFVIEEKFGFNRTTFKTFIVDTLKSLLITILIASLIVAALIWFFATTGAYAWSISWVALTALQLFFVFIAPIVIMPLFNKFTPLTNGELKTAIENYAKSQNFTLSGLFTMDGSKRSTKSNAFFTGFGRYKRIVLFDTLIKDHTTEELVAVLAHEIGHYKHKHIHKMMMVSTLLMGIMLYVFSLLIGNQGLFAAFGMTHTSIYASFIFISMLFSPVNEIVSVFTNILSRKHEFEADAYAVTTYPHKQSFIDALKKLSVSNLSNLHPHPLKVWKDYSHPPVLARIREIEILNPKS